MIWLLLALQDVRVSERTDALARLGGEWAGHGIALAFLLWNPEKDDLAGLLADLENPSALLARSLDEPAYEPTLALLRKRHGELRKALVELRDSGFSREWSRAGLEGAVEECRRRLTAIDLQAVRKACRPFGGDGGVTVVVTAYTGSIGYRLPGEAIGISAAAVRDLGFLLPHEICHRFNPSPRLLDRLEKLAERDPDYAKARRRIHVDHREGKEEEFVFAAGLYVSVRLGLLTRTAAIRRLKLAYPNLSDLRDAGVPVATLAFDELSRNPPGENSDYESFLATLLDREGGIRDRVRTILAEVAGIAGVQIEMDGDGARVVRVFDGYPAADAGLRKGDRILSVGALETRGRSLDEVLDVLAGPRGAERRLKVRRGGSDLEIRLTLE